MFCCIPSYSIFLWFTSVLFYSIHGGKRTFQFHSFSLIMVQKRTYSPFYSLHSYFRSFITHTVYLLRPQTLYILYFSWLSLKLRSIGSALYLTCSHEIRTYTYQAGYTYVTYVVIILIFTRVLLVKNLDQGWKNRALSSSRFTSLSFCLFAACEET